ncbi:MAG: hypothetical protein NC313_05580 [Butyrivibrio sp.]|nr:hypothetical protein [Butyrivibrio sp.]
MNIEKSISSFLHSPQMSKLNQFYADLRAKQNEGVWDILILITRKGFWIYDIIKECIVNSGVNGGDREYTDRYLMMALDHGFIEGKKICLVDDTISNGYSMFRYYCILKRQKALEIVPCVYAMSTSFPRDTVKEEMLDICRTVFNDPKIEAENVYEEFLSAVKCYRVMSQDKISRFCLAETEFFQQVLCPMVINLPMMINKAAGSVLKDNFIMSKQQFRQLTEGDLNWQYIQNEYGGNESEEQLYRVTGGLKEIIQCNYFYYTDDFVLKLKDAFLQNMVVKCKYNIDKDGNYQVIFTPFAIVRSMDKTETKQAFELLMQGTEYGDALLNKLNSDPDESENMFLWTAAMRSVIYILSLYAGEKFKEYLAGLGFTDTGYDKNIMAYNSEQFFIKAMDEIDPIERVKALCDSGNFKRHTQIFLSDSNMLPNMTDVYEVIHLKVLEASEKENREGGLDIGGIESALTEEFSFSSYTELGLTVTSIILVMLEISAFGNYIQVMEQTVWRGFRHGENTKLLLPSSGRLCYICAEVLYIVLGEGKYQQKIEGFLDEMKKHLKDINALAGSFEEKYFDSYAKWFVDKKDDAKFHILGKEFILDQLNEKETELHDYAVWAVENSEDVMRRSREWEQYE